MGSGFRRVLITGAASGIGAAAARAMAGPGVALLLHTRRHAAGLAGVAAAARAAGAEVREALGDLADPAAPAALVGQAVAAWGGLDVVIANAGFADRTPVASLEDGGFARSLDAILWGFLRLARAAGPLLAAGEAPRLVAVSSFVAHVFRTDTTLFPASAAAKAGVEALVRTLAVEWAPAVCVNAVVPGFTRKDAGAHAAIDPRAWEAVLPRIPLGRLGTPEEVAAVIAFLASPAAGYVTGQCWHVNGGLTGG